MAQVLVAVQSVRVLQLAAVCDVPVGGRFLCLCNLHTFLPQCARCIVAPVRIRCALDSRQLCLVRVVLGCQLDFYPMHVLTRCAWSIVSIKRANHIDATWISATTPLSKPARCLVKRFFSTRQKPSGLLGVFCLLSGLCRFEFASLPTLG